MDWGKFFDIVAPIAAEGIKYYTGNKAAKAAAGAAQDSAAYQMAAAQYASDTERAIAEANLKFQADMYNSSIARMEPWRQAGLNALPKASFYAGVPNSGYAPNLGHLDPRIQELNRLWNAYQPQNVSGNNSLQGIGIGSGGITAPTIPTVPGDPTAGGLPSSGVDSPGVGDFILSALPTILKNAPELASSLGIDLGSILGGSTAATGAASAATAGSIGTPLTASEIAAATGTVPGATASGVGAASGATAAGTTAAGTGAGAFGIEGLGMQAAGLTGANLALGAGVLGLPFLAKALFGNEKDRSQIYGNYENGAYVGNGNLQPGKQFVSEREQFLDPVAQRLYDAGYTGPLYLSYQPHSDPNKPGYYRYADPSTYTSNVNPYETYNDYGAEGEDRLSNYLRASRGARSQYVMGDKGTKDGSFRNADAFIKWYTENVPLPEGGNG